MRHTISPKAKRLTYGVALMFALTVGAFAMAFILFFSKWWAGLICLAASFACGGGMAILFFAYRAERRRCDRLAQEAEEEEQLESIMLRNGENPNLNGSYNAARPSRTSQPQPPTEASPRFDSADNSPATAAEDNLSATNTEGSTSTIAADGSSSTVVVVDNSPVIDMEGSTSTIATEDDPSSKPTTLEMKPPLRLMSVEEAKQHAPRSDENSKEQGDPSSKPATLEMKPPLRMMSVEEAERHTPSSDEKSKKQDENNEN